MSLLPNVRRTWAPRGRPPVLRHHCNWKRASMAAALCYGIGGGGAQLVFHVQAGSYDTDSLIGVLNELRRLVGGQKATLVWDGLGAHRSRVMQAFLAGQRDWLVVERLPAYAPELNRSRACGPTSRARSWPILAATPSVRSSGPPGKGWSGSARPGGSHIRSCDGLAYR